MSEEKEVYSSVRICGDDLAAFWSEDRIDKYEGIMRLVGGDFSVGKHFHSGDKLVFCEEQFTLRTGKKKKSR